MARLHDVPYFDRFARFYEFGMPAADAATLSAGLRRADRRIQRVVDVGGGTGRAARELSAPERLVLDASAPMLREARGHGLDCVQGDASTMPLADESVDAVTVVDALHHMADADAVISEAARILRPGGVLVIREFDPTTLRGRALVALERLVGFESTFYPPNDLALKAEDAGLTASYKTGFGFTVAGVKPRS